MFRFSNQIDAGFQGFGTLFPFGGTYLVGMTGNEEGGFDLAEQLVGIAADAVVLYLGNLDTSFGIYKERTTVGHTVFFNHYAKGTAQHAGRVGQHGIGYLRMLSEASCQALCTKCESVLTE